MNNATNGKQSYQYISYQRRFVRIAQTSSLSAKTKVCVHQISYVASFKLLLLSVIDFREF